MTIKVEIEGRGVVAEFPDGTPQEVIDASVKRDFFSGEKTPTTRNEKRVDAMKQTLPAMKDIAIGAGKGIIETATTLAPHLPAVKLAKFIGSKFGVDPTAIFDDPDFKAALEGENTPQKMGKFAERAAEVASGEAALNATVKAVPTLVRAAEAAPKIATIVKGAVVGGGASAAQGGDATTGAVVGGGVGVLQAGIPALVNYLRGSATKLYSRVLGATKNANKELSERVVPELIDRGVRGSRQAISERAATEIAETGAKLDEAWAALPDDAAIGSRQITKPLDDEIARLSSLGPEGVKEARVLKALGKTIVESADDAGDVGVRRLRELRQFWDEIVSRKEGFAGGGLTPREVAHKKAADAIREKLNTEFPDIGAINREYAFWKRTGKIVDDTIRRTAGQGSSLTENAAAVVAGAVSLPAGPGHAAMNAIAAKELVRASRSGYWKSTSAVMKDRLANAIAAGNSELAAQILRAISTGAASEATSERVVASSSIQ